MMYAFVAKAIKEYEVDAKPTDYLMFFCLAKREGINDKPEDIGPPAEGTNAEQVYVHICAYVRAGKTMFSKRSSAICRYSTTRPLF